MLNNFLNYNKIKTFCQAGWPVLILFLILFIPHISKGDLIDNLNSQIQQQEQKKAELERKAREYQQVINQKQSEIKSLNNQVAIFNARTEKLQVEIKLTEDDISQTNLEIIRLDYGIEEAERDTEKQRKNLASIIQTIAEYDQTSEIEIVLQSENFSDFFNQLSYLEDLQTGVQEKVENLRLLKFALRGNKNSKEEKKEELEGLKSQLDDQKFSLASQKNTKETLITHTRGEESKYQQLLANIEAQRKSLLGDIARLRDLKAAELARLKEMQEKPPAQYWASTNWYYKQDDARWGKDPIGISSLELEDYGCAVTSIAMLFSYYGQTITPKQLAREPIFYYALIVWPKRWGDLSCINCPPPHTTPFDWSRLDRELGAGYPVIVFIRANGSGSGHYVVVHHKTNDGRYVVHDPFFGPNIYLDSSRVYLSNLFDTSTTLDQMIIYH